MTGLSAAEVAGLADYAQQMIGMQTIPPTEEDVRGWLNGQMKPKGKLTEKKGKEIQRVVDMLKKRSAILTARLLDDDIRSADLHLTIFVQGIRDRREKLKRMATRRTNLEAEILKLKQEFVSRTPHVPLGAIRASSHPKWERVFIEAVTVDDEGELWYTVRKVLKSKKPSSTEITALRSGEIKGSEVRA